MPERVRLAKIGVTYPHAEGYIESLLLMPEVEVVALYDAEPHVAMSAVPAEWQSLPLYDVLGDLLAKERPEAVLITLANDVTPAVIAQCAEAGAHVFAEKPCARTAAEFMPAAEAVRKAGVQFATGFTRRVSPVGTAIKDLVDRGVLGRLVSVEASWVTTSVTVRDPRHVMFSAEHSGGGILHWLGCHWLDFMRWSSSSEVTDVAAIMDTVSGEAIDVEDTASLSLRYSNGMVGSLHCAHVIDKMPHQLFFGLRGTDGWVRWEGNGPDLEVRSSRPEWTSPMTQVLHLKPDPLGGYEGGEGIFLLRRFIATFRDGADAIVGTEDVLRMLEVIGAAHESSRTGRRVAPTRTLLSN